MQDVTDACVKARNVTFVWNAKPNLRKTKTPLKRRDYQRWNLLGTLHRPGIKTAAYTTMDDGSERIISNE